MPHLSQQGDPPDDYGRARAARQRRRQFASSWVRTECRSRLLLMNRPAVVQIIGAPIACVDGFKDPWREVAEWAAGQLSSRFGDSVCVEYFDLFDPGCPPVPEGAQLPLAVVN